MSDASRDGGRLDRLEELPIVDGFLAGLGGFLGGYVVFVGLLVGSGALTFSQGLTTALRSAAQVFYNAFNVPTYTRQTLRIEQGGQVQEQVTEVWSNSVTGFQSITRTQLVDGEVVNEVSGGGTAPTVSALPDVVYLAVPILAIVAVGVVLGYRAIEVDALDPNEIVFGSVAAGVAMAAGFLALSLGLSFVLVRTGENAVLYPARSEAVLYGIAYPLVGGTASAALGQVLQGQGTGRDGPDSDEADEPTEDRVARPVDDPADGEE